MGHGEFIEYKNLTLWEQTGPCGNISFFLSFLQETSSLQEKDAVMDSVISKMVNKCCKYTFHTGLIIMSVYPELFQKS